MLACFCGTKKTRARRRRKPENPVVKRQANRASPQNLLRRPSIEPYKKFRYLLLGGHWFHFVFKVLASFLINLNSRAFCRQQMLPPPPPPRPLPMLPAPPRPLLMPPAPSTPSPMHGHSLPHVPPRMPHYFSARSFPCRLRSRVPSAWRGVGLLGHEQIRFP